MGCANWICMPRCRTGKEPQQNPGSGAWHRCILARMFHPISVDDEHQLKAFIEVMGGKSQPFGHSFHCTNGICRPKYKELSFSSLTQGCGWIIWVWSKVLTPHIGSIKNEKPFVCPQGDPHCDHIPKLHSETQKMISPVHVFFPQTVWPH